MMTAVDWDIKQNVLHPKTTTQTNNTNDFSKRCYDARHCIHEISPLRKLAHAKNGDFLSFKNLKFSAEKF